jgi:hypothetical protein
MLLAPSPTPAAARAFADLPFNPPRPTLEGRTIYFNHPAILEGRRSPFNFERALGVRGTARSAAIVDQILARMG